MVADNLTELVAGMNKVTGDALITEESLRRTITERDRQLDNPYSKDTQVTFIRGHRNYRGDKLIRIASPHKFLDPANGPLIAVRLNILSRKTLGGLHTDLDARVLQPSGEPLPGVYAAGEVAGFGGGGVHGYNALEGTFLGGCIFSGRTAGPCGGCGGRLTVLERAEQSSGDRNRLDRGLLHVRARSSGHRERRSRVGRMSGRVVHFEIPFDDGDRARKFYAEAFGWTINEIPDLHYSIVQTGPTEDDGFPTETGYIGGGMLKRESPTDRPVITIDVEDIDEALAKIEELGGMTVLGRQDVGDMGWAAYFKDVEGNLMGLWQSRQA